jgi:outer membrane immunogenic protein
MKKLLLGSLALAATLAGPAMAADMPLKAPPPPVAAFYDWSGFYLGASAGWIWTTVDRSYPNVGSFTNAQKCTRGEYEQLTCTTLPFNGVLDNNQGLGFSTSRDEFVFDVHAGVQGQWGWLVLGVEGEALACENECRSFTGVLPSPPFNEFTSARHSINWMYTVGGRAGIAWDTLLFYVTGGGMYAGLHGTYCNTSAGAPIVALCGPPQTLTQNGNSGNWGYYAGIGIEGVLYKGPLVDVIGGLEYRHFDVGTKNAFCFNPGCGPVTGADYDLSMHGDLIQARLNIKTHGFGFFWGP